MNDLDKSYICVAFKFLFLYLYSVHKYTLFMSDEINKSIYLIVLRVINLFIYCPVSLSVFLTS